MGWFHGSNPAPAARPRTAIRITRGWFQSSYGDRAGVSIVRHPDRLEVVQMRMGANRQSENGTAYEGPSVREAVKAANQQMQMLRLRGFRAPQSGMIDTDFTLDEVCLALDLA